MQLTRTKHEALTQLCTSLFLIAKKSFRVNVKISGVMYANCPWMRCKLSSSAVGRRYVAAWWWWRFWEWCTAYI